MANEETYALATEIIIAYRIWTIFIWAGAAGYAGRIESESSLRAHGHKVVGAVTAGGARQPKICVGIVCIGKVKITLNVKGQIKWDTIKF